jgi:hypothetical protein
MRNQKTPAGRGLVAGTCSQLPQPLDLMRPSAAGLHEAEAEGAVAAEGAEILRALVQRVLAELACV